MCARSRFTLVFVSAIAGAAAPPAGAQEPAASGGLCKEHPCSLLIDWARAGGVASLGFDRRYGNAAELEARLRARLEERGYTLGSAESETGLRLIMVPLLRNAICDELAGTNTDHSCRAIGEVQVQVQGPDSIAKRVEIPARLRNQCGADRLMAVDRLAPFLADWIIYGLNGKTKGERRPAARC